MQAVFNTLNTIRQQLGELTQTARLLIASLMVILVMTLFLVAQYTSRSSMEPLGLHANLGSDQRGRAINYLQSRGIPYRERGGEILVPVDQKYAALAGLTDGEIISPDQINFDSLVQQDSPFLSKAQNNRRWLIATMNVLARTIRNMETIEWAEVVIDEPKNPGGIGRAHIPASASVTVRSRRGSLEQDTVDAIAELVAGAHASLRAENVRVIDARSGRHHRARSEESLHASTNFELRLSQEKVVQQKIADALGYIPGVNVAVSITVDTRAIVQHRRDFEDPKQGVTAESTRRLESSSGRPGGEAGVRPNTGADIAGSGTAGSQLSDERSETAMIPVFGGSKAQITDHRGYPLQINTTIGVPRSYFIRLYQDRQNDEAAQPDPDELDAIVEAETERIRSQIEPLIDTRAVDGAIAGTVMVSMIPDFALATAGFVGGASAATAVEAGGYAPSVAADGLIKHVSLGALALLSLIMMFLMVRKATVREELPTAAELVGEPPALANTESDLVGEADESNPSLEGLEINEDDLKRQQMLGQINEMAKSEPEEAAALLRRWIKSEV